MTTTLIGAQEIHRRSFFKNKITWFFGKEGAHFRFPGYLYVRTDGNEGWSTGKSWRLFGIVSLVWMEPEKRSCNPSGWSVNFFTVDWRAIRQAFRKAKNNTW